MTSDSKKPARSATDGLSGKFAKFRLMLSGRRRKVFRHDDAESRFTEIFKNNYWRNKESVSGCGSTLEYTENLRKALPALFAKHNIASVFDAPCGDFNWMRLVVEETGTDYVGGDIVAPLIEQNQEKYGREGIKFIHCDITKGPMEKADLMIVRDCLFHLSYRNILAFLKLFAASDIPLLLTTSHLDPEGGIENKDVITGHFRRIDLFAAPFSFPDESIYRILDDLPGQRTREMVLFTREQVAVAAKNLEEYLA